MPCRPVRSLAQSHEAADDRALLHWSRIGEELRLLPTVWRLSSSLKSLMLRLIPLPYNILLSFSQEKHNIPMLRLLKILIYLEK